MSGLFAAGMAASLAASGVSMYSKNQQLKQQDQATAAGIRRQQQLSDQGQQDVKQTIQKVATDNSSNEQANTQAEMAAYTAALARAQSARSDTSGSAGATSAQYKNDTNAANTAVAANGRQYAANAAAADAPLLTQQQDSASMGDTATKLGLLSDASKNQSVLSNIQTASIAENPWLQSAAALLNGVGSGMTARGLFGPGSSSALAKSGIAGGYAEPSTLGSSLGSVGPMVA